MITLFTGLPGNAKTLKVLQWLQKKALAENRDVYYAGINECNVPCQLRADGTMSKPWVEIDPKEWVAVPDGSLIVIDEAQDTFEKKNSGAPLPEYYKMLAKHRHAGKDLVLVTQHPSLIDNFARKLVQQHFHAVRKFGMQRSTYYEWDKVVDQPEKPAAQKNAVSVEKFSYPKEIFGWYKSASSHTVKRRVPLKLILAVVLVAVLLSYAVYMVRRFVHRGDAAAPVASAVAPASPGAGGNSPVSRASKFDPRADAVEFVAAVTPRVAGLPQTAPRYDELTKPVRVPVPSMCIQKGDICKCWSQQATPMDVGPDMCKQFATNGFFQDFDPDKDKGGDARSARPLDAAAVSSPARPVPASSGFSGAFIDVAGSPAAPAPGDDNVAGPRPHIKAASVAPAPKA